MYFHKYCQVFAKARLKVCSILLSLQLKTYAVCRFTLLYKLNTYMYVWLLCVCVCNTELVCTPWSLCTSSPSQWSRKLCCRKHKLICNAVFAVFNMFLSSSNFLGFTRSLSLKGGIYFLGSFCSRTLKSWLMLFGKFDFI